MKPDGESEILDLMDNGTNADTVADDGVYSRYFTGATMKGRYTVKCQVVSNDETLISQGFFGSASLQLHGTKNVLSLRRNTFGMTICCYNVLICR